MPPASNELKELTSKVDRLCVLFEAEFGSDTRKGRVYVYLDQLKEDFDKLEHRQDKTDKIIDGNGSGEGLAAKVSTLWRERDKKIKAFGHIILGALTTLFGWFLAWFFGGE